MKVLLSLTVLCLALALAHGACAVYGIEAYPTKDGEWVVPDGCPDPFDKTMHPFGSSWDTKQCNRCHCGKTMLSCCVSNGPVGVPGCKSVFDWKTCKHKFYKEDDPTTLCSFQL